jgi:hypothetical protein
MKKRTLSRATAARLKLVSVRKRIHEHIAEAQRELRAALPLLGQQELLSALEVALVLEPDLSRVADHSHLHRIAGLRGVRRGSRWMFTVEYLSDLLSTYEATDASAPAGAAARQPVEK